VTAATARPADWGVIAFLIAAGMIPLGAGRMAFGIGRWQFITLLGGAVERIYDALQGESWEVETEWESSPKQLRESFSLRPAWLLRQVRHGVPIRNDQFD